MIASLFSKFLFLFSLSILGSVVVAADAGTAVTPIEYATLRIPDSLAARDTILSGLLVKRQSCSQQGEGDCPAPIGQCCPVGNTCCTGYCCNSNEYCSDVDNVPGCCLIGTVCNKPPSGKGGALSNSYPGQTLGSLSVVLALYFFAF